MSDGATTSAPASAWDRVADAAVAVIGIRAQADVGHHDQIVAERLLEPGGRALHGAVRVPGKRAVGGFLRTGLGMTEQQHGAYAERELVLDDAQQVLDAELCESRQRRDRLLGLVRRQHETRHDELRRRDPGLCDQVAQRGRAPQAPRPDPARCRDR